MKHKITCIHHCCDLHEADLDNVIKKAKEEERERIIYLIEHYFEHKRLYFPLVYNEWNTILKQKLKTNKEE